VGAVLALLAMVGPGCSADVPGEVHFETVVVKLKDKAFTLEVADTVAKRARGLMYRDSMPADHGMIFLFATADKYGFWMKNTKIPLDLVFLDEKGKVVGIYGLKPNDETPVAPDKPAKFAIELNAGTAAKVGLKTGDVVELPEKVLKAKAEPDEN